LQISAFRSTPGCSLSGKEDILRVISSCSRGFQGYKSIHLIQDELTSHVSFARRTLNVLHKAAGHISILILRREVTTAMNHLIEQCASP